MKTKALLVLEWRRAFCMLRVHLFSIYVVCVLPPPNLCAGWSRYVPIARCNTCLLPLCCWAPLLGFQSTDRLTITEDLNSHVCQPGVGTLNGQAWKDNRQLSLRILQDLGFGKSSLEAVMKVRASLFRRGWSNDIIIALQLKNLDLWALSLSFRSHFPCLPFKLSYTLCGSLVNIKCP